MSESDSLPLLPALRPDFQCHHGSDTVSEAVHRARLAADDPACVGCPHGHPQRPSRLEFDDGNVRGRYLNVIDRGQVRQWCRSIASTLLQQATSGTQPVVVVGHDERASSPDLAVSLQELSLSGCEVIDIGRTLRPLLDFAVRRAGADAGLMITGGRRPAGWTGVDLVGRGARPWSWPGRAEAACGASSERVGRVAGKTKAGRIDGKYLEDLKQSAHGLRPLTSVVFCQSPVAVSISCDLASVWPGETYVDRITSAEANDVERTLRALRYRGYPAFDVAAVVSVDGRDLVVLDENAQPVAASELMRGLAELHGDPVEIKSECVERDEQIDADEFDGWTLSGTSIWSPDDQRAIRRDAFWVLTQLMQRLSVSDLTVSQVFQTRASGL